MISSASLNDKYSHLSKSANHSYWQHPSRARYGEIFQNVTDFYEQRRDISDNIFSFAKNANIDGES